MDSQTRDLLNIVGDINIPDRIINMNIAPTNASERLNGGYSTSDIPDDDGATYDDEELPGEYIIAE